jgi:probable phosphoglycerate mutase
VALAEFDGPDCLRIIYRNDNSHLSDEISTFARQKWLRSSENADANLQARLDVDLTFRPVDMKRERDLVEACRRDAWQTIHGSLEHYDAQLHLRQAERMARLDPRAVVFAEHAGQIVGLLQLDPEETTDPDTGHISFVYLKDRYRGRNVGIQLIGQAVSFYRELGKRRLRLRVAENNLYALSFYKKAGFYRTDWELSPTGTMFILNKDIFPDI